MIPHFLYLVRMSENDSHIAHEYDHDAIAVLPETVSKGVTNMLAVVSYCYNVTELVTLANNVLLRIL